jgi:hypothetical protein
MPDLFQLLSIVDALALPAFGFWALLATKLSVGDALRRAERQFMVALVIISLVTLNTVVGQRDVWLSHTMTLALMVMGVFLIPSREEAVVV